MGRLNVSKKTAYGRRFKIVHEKTKCSLSLTVKGFTAVKRVREKIKCMKTGMQHSR
jgi:hypothetical protein